MADYGQSCCGRMGGHEVSCKLHHNYPQWKKHHDFLAEMRTKGFVEISNGLFSCRRGCGTVVWNITDHIKNVCPTFEPVVG